MMENSFLVGVWNGIIAKESNQGEAGTTEISGRSQCALGYSEDYKGP